MFHYFTQADAEYGHHVAEGLGVKVESSAREGQLASR
jgi:catalase